MNQTNIKFLLLTWLIFFTFGLTSCSTNPMDQDSSDRPACVRLDLYDEILGQQFSDTPDWKLLNQTKGFSQYQWVIQNTTGTHSLNAVLNPGGCICATKAASQFHFGKGEETLVGLLEGAAVVPLSDLNFTTKWLEPKISFQCTIANILHRTYSAESKMKDGTTWKLTCSRLPGDTTADSAYEFSVTTPDCLFSE
jgi:hypothetical protein